MRQREIIFRGKPKYGAGWAYGFYSIRAGISYISFMNEGRHNQWTDVEVIPETIGQYINLEDSFGDKIYEGDIVHTNTGKNYIVAYADCWGRYMLSHDNESCYKYITDWPDKETLPANMGIIGNISDNPELLGGK